MAKHPFKKKIHLFISDRRSNWLFKKLFGLAKKYIKIYENRNNDHITNGELRVIKILAKHNPKVVFDVGANVGDWSILAEKSFPNAQVHCFEPMPAIFEHLKKNTDLFKRITINNFGLSDQTQNVEFNYFPDRTIFTSRYDIELKNTKMEKVFCELRNGNDYCEEKGIAEIDFLKIDTEGGEPLVLAGFTEMLQAKKIKMIQFEYSTINITTKYLLKDFYTFFAQYGYEVGKVYSKAVEFKPYHLEMEDFIGLNYIAIPKEAVELKRQLSYD